MKMALGVSMRMWVRMRLGPCTNDEYTGDCMTHNSTSAGATTNVGLY